VIEITARLGVSLVSSRAVAEASPVGAHPTPDVAVAAV
jgi:hypothetical protein